MNTLYTRPLAAILLVGGVGIMGCAHRKPIVLRAERRESPLRVHRIGGPISRAWLIESPGGLVLVDTGLPGNDKRILRQMRRLGRDDMRLIFITHAHMDHYGSADALRRATGAPIAIHRVDAVAMAEGRTPVENPRGWGRLMKPLIPLMQRIWRCPETPADILVEEGDSLERFGLAAIVLHLPGHTPGSAGLLLEGKYLFAGDLFATGFRLHGQRMYAANWEAVAQSCARIHALAPERVFPGHGRSSPNQSHDSSSTPTTRAHDVGP